MDGVELSFEEKALEAVAELAIEREIGARGLRAVLEGVMQKVMYDVPSENDIAKVIITEDSVRGKNDPIIIRK